MPTRSQDNEFASAMSSEVTVPDIVVSNDALDNAIHWMQRNLSPDDVFSEKDLIAWAESNGFELKGDE